MGGTLDNGIYLPDQGERNCYNGLKNNWDTLDNLIETVQALSSAGLTREIVNSLPTENIKTNVIYMLRNSQQSGDLYDEYMYINNAWEPIGTSATEMDNYYTKSETNDLPAVKSGITASKVTGYDSHVANTEVHITAAERSTWNGKQNALDADQTAAVNSGVNATKVTGYDTHVADTVVHVTASDKTAWNAKQDGLSQAQLNAVNSGVTSAKVTGYDTHVADSSAHVSSADRTAWNGKQDALSQTQLDNIAAVPDKANSADLATVATTGDYGDLLNAPTIPTVNNATLTIQKNGTDVATFTANASSNVTANLAIPTDTSDLTNGAGFLTQHNPVDNELSVSSENAVQNKVVTAALNGKAASSHTHAAGDINTGTFNIARIPNLDASKITSGTIDIARLPKGSLERLVKVADQAARYALTTDDVQLGDTVQQLDTGVMYVVTDETKLDSADGYTEFTAGSATSVPWSGVTGKPSTFTPSSHTHGNITNDGKVGTTANLPLITGTGGVVQAGSFGNAANTFCEGNDSRLSDARTPVAHTHTKSDVTDLFNSANTWTGDNIFSGTNSFTAANINIKSSDFSLGDTISSNQVKRFQWYDASNNRYACIAVNYATDKSVWIDIPLRTKNTEGTSFVDKTIRFQVKPDNTSAFLPVTNSVTDLGTSTNQWNNLYAKGYYYNGVAWGLDKENVWNTYQTIKGYYFGNEQSPNGRTCLYLTSNRDTVGQSGIYITKFRQNRAQGAMDPADLQFISFDVLENSIRTNGALQLNITNWNEDGDVPSGAVLFSNLSNAQLGSPLAPWKNLNGVNPGALSLPDTLGTSGTENVNYFNVIGYLNNTGTLAIIPSTATYDGWLYINAKDGADSYIIIDDSPASFGTSVFGNNGLGSQSIGLLCLMCPIRKGHAYNVRIKSAGIVSARIYPAQGNV